MTAGAPGDGRTLPQLTSLRFLAALAVLLSHLTFLGDDARPLVRHAYDRLFREGYSGVSFFYILSGFVITCAYRERLVAGAVTTRDYLLLRVVRLAPLHWIVTGAFALWLIGVKHDPPAISTLTLNLLMLHAWVPAETVHYSLNGPSWSLSCELFFYLMFPLLLGLRRRTLALLWVLGLGVVLAAAVSVIRRDAPYSPTGEWFFYVLPATRLLEFVTGMFLFDAYRGGIGRRWASTGSEVALLLALPVMMTGYVRLDVPMPLRWQLAYLPPMAALVLVFAHGRGLVSRMLAHPFPVLLGEASFALYLTHRPVVTFVERWSGGRAVALAVGLVIGCTALSVFVFRLVDQPSQRLLRPLVLGWSRRLGRKPRGWFRPAVLAVGAAAIATVAAASASSDRRAPVPSGPIARTDVGLNLFGLAPYNRQQVFTNLIAQSEWFTSESSGWTVMPAAQLDSRGWVRFLRPGQVAPRPFVLPPAPVRTVRVRCTFAGKGRLSAGGIARLVDDAPGAVDLLLESQGKLDEAAWVQLDATDPANPLRDLDCRDRSLPQGQVFHPAFVASLDGFSAIRFLDWQRVNDNPASRWPTRTRPGDSTQAGPGGVAIEHMVALANATGTDPWFIMPYQADEAYVAGFARYVHDHLAPGRTVYVELGNEVWNDMFDAAKQARREGLALGLAPGDDAMRAQMRRYAQKSRVALRIWSQVFADRPSRLVRVVSSINVWPDVAEMILSYEDMARWTDALATAPYITLDPKDLGEGDVDRVFARLDAATDATIRFAAANKAIAARYGKRFITYEGGQHLVTPDLVLARRIQRDPRMARVYARYLDEWRDRIGDRLMLYASTAPIGEYGAWGLVEYAGQPMAETPKLRAVRSFLRETS